MDFLSEWINDWLKDLLVDGIMGNLSDLFESVNGQIGEIATQVGTTPGNWNPGVFSLIRQLSETVVLPIAGLVLTFVMCYELIQMLIDRNNLHDIDTWIFFKWIFKTFVAVLLLSNTFNIVMAVFEVSQSVINSAGGLIAGETAVSPGMLESLEAELIEMEVGPLLGLWMQSFLIKIVVVAINIVVFVIVYGRMIEIYLLTSLAPVPMATMVNREIGSMGQNYLKTLCAIAFQGLLILVCVAIYAKLMQSIAIGGDPIAAIWTVIGYSVLLCFTMFKTGTLAKSIFGAH
ncbi:VirB6/TrbL-like conjugal transfer protein, CD1112 family [Paenibacillus sp. RS8]|uniref:VirB6/TrbL-like conjugal transfer protein, CD1112 family n=1 Tax=Paenibacillus sp. RS8 TaxID=3242681 RepID=UPI0035C106B0